jgi:hypothetical protein
MDSVYKRFFHNATIMMKFQMGNLLSFQIEASSDLEINR